MADDQPGGGVATFGLRLLLLSLTVLFAASLLGYGITRARLGDGVVLPLPGLLWISTAVLLLGGAVLEIASWRLRRRDGRGFRGLITLAFVLSVAFLAVQGPALWQLLQGHLELRDRGNPLLGFGFFLILLHALHVLVGLGWLGRLVWRAWRGDRLPERDAAAVRHVARYWIFLDIVWLVMFGAFLLG